MIIKDNTVLRITQARMKEICMSKNRLLLRRCTAAAVQATAASCNSYSCPSYSCIMQQPQLRTCCPIVDLITSNKSVLASVLASTAAVNKHSRCRIASVAQRMKCYSAPGCVIPLGGAAAAAAAAAAARGVPRPPSDRCCQPPGVLRGHKAAAKQATSACKA
jgi:hypothetical protein